jgi:small nuclear ribonucleoprotein (snRNP)-like protein
MAKKKQSENDGQYKVGDHVTAKLSDGREVEATMRAVSQQPANIQA